VKDLRIDELELVAGGFGVGGAVAGAISAGAGYIGYQTMVGEGSLRDFAGAVALGAVSGFLLGPAGAQAVTSSSILGGQVMFYGGMASGMAMNAAGTNYNR
jgi:hypothetical protein